MHPLRFIDTNILPYSTAVIRRKCPNVTLPLRLVQRRSSRRQSLAGIGFGFDTLGTNKDPAVFEARRDLLFESQ